MVPEDQVEGIPAQNVLVFYLLYVRCQYPMQSELEDHLSRFQCDGTQADQQWALGGA